MRSAVDPKTWVESHLVRVSQSSFLITGNTGLVIAIDPFSAFPAGTKADIILITHDHPDHFNAARVRSLLRAGTRIVVPASMKVSGREKGLATDAMLPGETREIGQLTLTTVRAYNLNKPMHPLSKGYVGYVLSLDGVRLYHAGDTDLIPEMSGLKADVALLPVGGLATMNARSAAEAARLIGAKVVVPMHYGKVPFSGGAGQKFAALFQGVTVLL